MRDQFGRSIEYMRVSVTDRCNLRCVYCMPAEGVHCVSHSDILTYDEITRICDNRNQQDQTHGGRTACATGTSGTSWDA